MSLADRTLAFATQAMELQTRKALGTSLLGLVAALAMLLARRPVAADTALPLGTLLAAAGWTIFLVSGWG